MASIISDLVLRTGQFQAGLKTAQNSVRSFGSAATGTVAKVSAIFSALTSSAAILGLKKAFDVGGALSDLSAQTGAAVSDLVVLQQAFQNSGLSAEEVGPAIARLQKAVNNAATGNSSAADTFTRLGLSAQKLSGLSATDQMNEIGAAIAKVENPTGRAALAMEIFGRKGAAMLTLFADTGALGNAASQIGNQAQLLDKNANLFDDISDKLALAGSKVQGFFVGVADKVAPVLKPLLDGFAGLDLSGLGQQVGDVVAFLIQSFSSGQVGEILGSSIEIALKNAANSAVALLAGIASALGQYLTEAVSNALTLFSILREPSFWSGLGNTLLGLAQSFIAALLDGVASVIESLRKVPVIGERIGNAAAGIQEKAASIRAAGHLNRAEGADDLAPHIARARGRMLDALVNIGAAFQQGAASAPKLLDTGDAEERLGSAIDTVFEAIEQNRQAAEEFAAAPRGPIAPLDDEGKTAKGRGSIAPVFAQSLARIGGGGVSVGGGADPMLQETRRQSSLLAQIARNTTPKTPPRNDRALTAVFA